MKNKTNMKSLLSVGILGLMLGSVAQASNPMTGTEHSKHYEMMNASTEMTAKVKSIDYKTRKITLVQGSDTFDITADKEVINFNQIKKGDTVSVKYKEAIVLDVHKGGKASGPRETDTAWRGKPGEKPQAGVSSEVTQTVVISKIDRKEPSVTFKDVDGETQKFKVMHPERLEGVNVGDSVDITYSEAMAVKVEKKSSKQ